MSTESECKGCEKKRSKIVDMEKRTEELEEYIRGQAKKTAKEEASMRGEIQNLKGGSAY